MIQITDDKTTRVIIAKDFPDGTKLIREAVMYKTATIIWNYEREDELFTIYCLGRSMKEKGCESLHLKLPYIPNARMDRERRPEDIATIKYFAEIINQIGFDSVEVFDPHSSVAAALINNIRIISPVKQIEQVMKEIKLDPGKDILFYPDDGCCKRLSDEIRFPYLTGYKHRNWENGKVNGTQIVGDIPKKPFNALVVDDICAYGGTAYFSLKALKEAGADKIWLYFSHSEKSMVDPEALNDPNRPTLYNSGLFEKIYTTDSIFLAEHDERVKVMPL